jgi:hypothetical protein
MKAPHQQVNDVDPGQKRDSGAAVHKRALVDNRHAMAAQRKLTDLMSSSARAMQLRALASRIDFSPQILAQRRKLDGLFSGGIQTPNAGAIPAALSPSLRKEQTNKTGVPDLLRSVASIQLAETYSRDAAASPNVNERVVQRAVRFVPGVAQPGVGVLGPFFRGTNQYGQIVRPLWTGRWANAVPPANNARNHVVAFHHISESLVNICNSIYAGWAAAPPVAAGVPRPVPGAVTAAVTALTGMSEALYPDNGIAEYAPMLAIRLLLIQYINNVVNHAAPTAAEILAIEQAATSLELHLASAPQNVRMANAGLNGRIGNNIDANYHLTQLPNPTAAVVAGPHAFLHNNAIPALWTVPGLAGGAPFPNWGRLVGGGQIGAMANFYVMDAVHNRIVDRFTAHATPHLGNNVTVVRNNDLQNLVPGYAGDAPLSSNGNPGGGNHPVILFDPAGVNLPRRFA